MARIDDLQSRADALLGTQPAAADAVTAALPDVDAGPPFSPFVPADLERAVEASERLMRAADAGGEEGIDAALAEAERLARELPPELVQHALQLFIVHHPDGSRLSIPPILPATEEERRPVGVTADAVGPEAALDYLREDPLANEHHRHWHLVYPASGRDGRLQDRQGELFFYMHRQMLARYDAERLSVGLEPVVAFDDYRAPIEEAYGERPPGKRLVDVDRVDDGRRLQVSLAGIEAQRDAIQRAIADGALGGASLVEAIGVLGALVEPQRGSPEPGIWHHGAGHMITAFVMHPNGGGRPGPIGSTRTAIRDPWFWRWHKHVDDFSAALEEGFDAHTFEDAPPVVLRSDDDPSGGDLVLVFDDLLPEEARADEAAARAWATDAFGGERFDEPPDPALATGELETAIAQTPFDPSDPATVPVAHLTHRAFHVAVRLRSTADDERRVTVRLFLAPEATAEDRRAWIELDKFDVRLEPGERAVACRATRLSSVIRKPATPEPQFVQPPAETPREQYCRCGWPYHLLIPRGTEEGMPFRLAAVVTDFALDHLHGDSDCGSLSFCGAADEEFPDRREMGYPFNRRFGERSIAETLAAHPSMAGRSLTIRHAGAV